MKHLTIIIPILILASCFNSNENNASQSDKDSIVKNKSNTSGLLSNSFKELVVNENCVIFLWPDSAEIEKIKAENDEEAYNEIIADLAWYPGIAAEVLDSFKIKNVSCNEEFLILKNSKNKETRLKRTDIDGDMILFRIDNEPIFSSAIEFNKDLILKFFDK